MESTTDELCQMFSKMSIDDRALLTPELEKIKMDFGRLLEHSDVYEVYRGLSGLKFDTFGEAIGYYDSTHVMIYFNKIDRYGLFSAEQLSTVADVGLTIIHVINTSDNFSLHCRGGAANKNAVYNVINNHFNMASGHAVVTVLGDRMTVNTPIGSFDNYRKMFNDICIELMRVNPMLVRCVDMEHIVNIGGRLIEIKKFNSLPKPDAKLSPKPEAKLSPKPEAKLSPKGIPKIKMTRRSRGELVVRDFLITNGFKFIEEHRFKDCSFKNPLPFDFYLPALNICIEYDGIQHSQPVDYFGGKKAFELQMTKDNIKNTYCVRNRIGLLRIDYRLSDAEVHSLLSSAIGKNKTNSIDVIKIDLTDDTDDTADTDDNIADDTVIFPADAAVEWIQQYPQSIFETNAQYYDRYFMRTPVRVPFIEFMRIAETVNAEGKFAGLI